MLHNPIAYFNTKSYEFDQELIESSILPVNDFFNFDENSIELTEVSEENKNLLINKYLYKTDGKATERLR